MHVTKHRPVSLGCAVASMLLLCGSGTLAAEAGDADSSGSPASTPATGTPAAAGAAEPIEPVVPIPPPAPPSPEYAKAYAEADKLYEAGAYDRAIGAYGIAYATDPRPEPLHMIGRCHHRMERGEEAAKAYERFLDDAGKDPRFAPGAEHFAVVTKTRGHLVDALRMHAEARLKIGIYADAHAIFARALGLDTEAGGPLGPGITGALHVGLGESLLGLGRRDEATEILGEIDETPLTPEMRDRLHAAQVELGLREPEAVSTAAADAERARIDALKVPVPRKKGLSKGAFYGLVGGGAALVVGAVVTTIVVVVVTGRPELGWHEVPAALAGW